MMAIETLALKTVQVAAFFGGVVVRITTTEGDILDLPVPDPEGFRKALAKAARDAKKAGA